jgi:hypothetical protein
MSCAIATGPALSKSDRSSACSWKQDPSWGRPLADRIQHSRLNNLKELRPGSAGRSEIRILYIFDPRRNAVLLVAGDKAGNWETWYRQAIPLAVQRYEDYLKIEATG